MPRLRRLLLLTSVAPLLLLCSLACRLSEFGCENSKCVSLSKYCDGSDDCGDGSDEPLACTNCNRTIYGQINVKYPLRITEPFQRYLPYVCTITFAAAGGDLGDIIELTFLSFQIGSFEMNSYRNQTAAACHKGYLKIIEPTGPSSFLRSQQTRGFTQLISALKKPSKQITSMFDSNIKEPSFGSFCGQMAVRSATYYSEGNNVSLIVMVPSKASILTYSFSLYLTYKFLPARPAMTRYGSVKEPYFLGTRLPYTYCDRVFEGCDHKNCKIRSPNYPGFYLRNITCNFWIRHNSITPGRQARIVLSQPNEYKISLYTGRTSTATSGHRALMTDCPIDVVRVYDGSNAASPVLAEFCGTGPLPEIISSSSEILLSFRSAPHQPMHNSRMEIDVSLRFVEANELSMRGGRCSFVFDGSETRSGVIYSPTHTMPANTTCTYQFKGKSQADRVWLYFLSYFAEDKHQWAPQERCDVSKLELYDVWTSGDRPEVTNANGSSNPISRFCEKTSPRICARAADSNRYIPLRPCKIPDESYLSNGPELMVRQVYYKHYDLYMRRGIFKARYEFIDTHQNGIPIENSACDRRFNSKKYQVGQFVSPKNLFFYGRGGSENITCNYHFSGLPKEKLRLTFVNLKLRSLTCEQVYDQETQQHRCRIYSNRSPKYSVLTVTETLEEAHMPVGCLCNVVSGPERPLILESVSSNVKVTFTVKRMSPFEDFNDYGFDASFQFLPSFDCDSGLQRRNGSEGEIIFTLPPDNKETSRIPLRCRWLVEASLQKYLYLKFRGTVASEGCSSKNRFVVYAGKQYRPMAAVCPHENPDVKEYDIFSLSWYNDTNGQDDHDLGYQRERIFVEIIAAASATFRMRWLEVTKPFLKTLSGQTLRNVDCLVECPELHACISPELWCDGTAHCPSGFDETYEHCRTFPTLYVAVGAGVGVILILIMLTIATWRCRQKGKNKAPRPVPTEDLPMESPHS